MFQLEVVFSQTPMRNRKNLFKRFIWSQNIHLNEYFSKKCAFPSLDWGEISEQPSHVQPSTGQEGESWCRYLLPSRRKLPTIFSLFSSHSGLCTVQSPCSTELSASWGHPNRSTAPDTFVVAAGPDPVFVLRNKACHMLRKPQSSLDKRMSSHSFEVSGEITSAWGFAGQPPEKTKAATLPQDTPSTTHLPLFWAGKKVSVSKNCYPISRTEE